MNYPFPPQATVIPPMLLTTFILLPPTELLNKNTKKESMNISIYIVYIVDTPRRIRNI
jgi:hypothetical protein